MNDNNNKNEIIVLLELIAATLADQLRYTELEYAEPGEYTRLAAAYGQVVTALALWRLFADPGTGDGAVIGVWNAN